MSRRMIRASEVGEYGFCRRAWWLRAVVGEEPTGHARRARGTALHRRHGTLVQTSTLLLIGGLVLAAIALALLVGR